MEQKTINDVLAQAKEAVEILRRELDDAHKAIGELYVANKRQEAMIVDLNSTKQEGGNETPV